jgi:hypothetical protein
MLPRFHSVFLALVVALLLIAGTIGVYSVEASTFRATMHEAQVIDQMTTTDAVDLGSDGPPMITSPGQPY